MVLRRLNLLKATCCLTGLLVLAAYAARAGEENALCIDGDTPWVVAPVQPEPLRRALEDVKRDWYKVLGHVPVVLDKPPASWKGPVIYLGLGGAALEALVQEPFPGPESFLLRCQTDAAGRRVLVATGADVRGAIYAAYALSEEILGVDPWYYWTDHEPAARKGISIAADFQKRFGPPTFKWRGWFINDEDLLNSFAPDALRENVFSPEMMDRICETLLRLRGNLIVPGTFMFPDERNNEVCFRRGLALNFHHIQVLGLNTWRWPKDVLFSYQRNPADMERYWQTCVDSLKDKEVVWTVGYRGKHDRPFWADEKGMDTPEARGAAISKAIARQVELVRKVQPKAPIISNLWMEGARMYHDGHIKLPDGVTTVWADDGTGIIDDKGLAKAGQGIYYHTAMLSGQHNQLSEMVPPGRIYSEMGRFVRCGGTEFFLVNVSDIRPVPLSTDCAMRMAWNATPYLGREDQANQDSFFSDWCQRQFGAEVASEAARAYALYFKIPYHQRALRKGDNALHTHLRQLVSGTTPMVVKGAPLSTNSMAMVQGHLRFIGQNKPAVAEVASKAEALMPRIPVERRQFFQGHLVTQAHIHLSSLNMLEGCALALDAYAKGNKAEAITKAEQALKSADELACVLHAAEYGKWSGWYRGEGFVGVTASRDVVRALLAALRGEPEPPARPGRGPWHYYDDILYRYQVPFLKNFPLLYPMSSPER
jgi:hypothetical protein